jgi:hypothetical protein
VRDLVLGSALFVVLVITLALPNLPGARVASAVTTQSPSIAAAPVAAGTGFTTCPSDTAWRPAADIGGPGDRDQAQAAVLHDGSSAHRMSCWTAQPQVLLFGYQAVAYEASDQSVAVLRVRPVTGYHEIVLTGPVRATILVMSDHRIGTIAVPEELVTKPLSKTYSSR